jgi:tetratricopeptide (TPR) repeat protein
MRFYERTENQAYLMKAYHYLGTLFLNWGNLDEAIHWFEKCRGLAKKSGEKLSLHTVTNNLALANLKIGNSKQALVYLLENQDDDSLLSIEAKIVMQNLLGNYWMNKGNSDSSRYYYTQSKQHSLRYTQFRFTSTAYTNLAVVEFESDPELSKNYFDSSVFYAFRSGLNEKISIAYYNLASWYAEMDFIDSAIVFYELSYIQAKKINDYGNMTDAIDEIIGLYRESGDWHLVDSLNMIIREIKTQQYQDFLSLTEDTELLESVFANDLSEQNKKVLNPSDIQFLNQTLLFSLIFFVVIQFVLILFLSTYLVRKRTKPL